MSDGGKEMPIDAAAAGQAVTPAGPELSREPKEEKPGPPPSVKQFVLFLLAGVPAFLVAVPLNIVLVELLQVPKAAAYAIVIVISVTANFFMCVRFVFKRDPGKSLWLQFRQFVASILFFRAMDWVVYTAAVSLTSIHYVIVQLVNVLIFSIAKYLSARFIIEKRLSKSA